MKEDLFQVYIFVGWLHKADQQWLHFKLQKKASYF